MLIVENCIISENIADRPFCCDLSQCKGQCCVEGDAGAPLDQDEVPVLERIYPQVEPYMTEAGRRAVARQGVAVDDHAGEPCTPLVENRECAYVVWDDGCALCAIEKAFRDGKIDYVKPLSCHLYPIRVDNYGQFISLNYHEWDVCKSAVCKGKEARVPLYIYLKEPLIRRFGPQWYDQLCQQVRERRPTDR